MDYQKIAQGNTAAAITESIMAAKINIKLVSVNPALAKQWLKNTADSGFSQRNAQLSVINKYAAEMSAGTWYEDTADVIRTCTFNGRAFVVLDGQHRLHAIVKSGITQKTFVATGVPPEAFKYVDVGATRTLQHMMVANGWENPQALSVVAKQLYRQDIGQDPSYTAAGMSLSPGTLLEWVEENHPDLHDLYASYKVRIDAAAKHLHLQPADVLFFFYQWRNAAPALAHDVLSWMANSERTEPPHIVFTYMADRLDSSHRDIANQKRAGMNIHSSAVKRLHMLQVLFAWQVANKVVKQSVTTSAGYSRCLNKWMGSQTTDSWVFA